MDKKGLEMVLDDHKKWIAGKGGARADLSYSDLSGCNFSKADLSGCNFFGADLSGCNFSRGNLSCADFSYSDLSGCNFSKADLSGCNFFGADLSGCNFFGADLSGCNFPKADLSGCNFSSWPLHRGSFFAKVDDRLVSQMVMHLAKLDVSGCSGGVQEAVEYIRGMGISELFKDYRDDLM